MRWIWLRNALMTAAPVILFSTCDLQQGPDQRDPWVGAWIMTDRCSADTTEYELLITKGSNLGDEILLQGVGLYQTGFVVEGVVTGTRLVIPVQSFLISSVPNLRYEYSGTGNIDNTEITIDYDVVTLQDGYIIAVDECRATGR